MKRQLVTLFIAVVAACGPAVQSPPTQVVVICPEGSVFDASMNACVARPRVVVIAPTATTPTPIAPVQTVPPIASTAPTVTATPVASAAPSASASVAIATNTSSSTAPPGSFAVDVTCGFSNGWVSIMPVSAYPRDDQFLMQALIGFTTEPTFWNSEREYTPFRKFAAKPCGATPAHFIVAGGDVWILAGQAGTFGSKGAYDKNGLKKKTTITAPIPINIPPTALTHTWLCISCPWVTFVGSDTSPFVMLAWRDEREKRGRDRKLVRQVPVKDGRIAVRVSEREDEETHLDALLLVVKDARGDEHVVMPMGGERSALSRDDGIEVRMSKGSEIAVQYDVGWLVHDGTVDVELVASGFYLPVDP